MCVTMAPVQLQSAAGTQRCHCPLLVGCHDCSCPLWSEPSLYSSIPTASDELAPVVDEHSSFLSSLFFCCMKTSREIVTFVLLDMKAKIYLCVPHCTVSDLHFQRAARFSACTWSACLSPTSRTCQVSSSCRLLKICLFWLQRGKIKPRSGLMIE